MGVDNRLVEYWRRQLASRRRLRLAPPAPSAAPAGLQPELGTDAPAGGDTIEDRSNVVPMTFEDR